MAVQIRLTGPEGEVRAAHARLGDLLAPGSRHFGGTQHDRRADSVRWYGDIDTEESENR